MTAAEWLKQHGISEKSIKRFHITWDENQVNIPIKNKEDKIIWVKHRNLNYDPNNPNSQKYLNDKGSKASVFNIRSHHDKPYIVLTEGEIDAIRLDQEGIPAISNTGGAQTFNVELIKPIADKNILIVYDNDEAGKNGIRKLLGLLPKAEIIELPLDSHDICDFFNLHTKADFINLIRNALTKEKWELKYQSPEYATITVEDLYKKEYPQENWIIDKFLPVNGIVMFSGDSGVGKSWLALEIVRAIGNNDIFLDHFEIKTSNVPILVIDKENGARRIQARLKSLGVPATKKVHFLVYPEKFTLENQEFMDSVGNFIIAEKIGIVILDSFIDVLIGNENYSGDTALIFNALRSISTNTCWVLLHHEVKPVPKFTPNAGDRARGSGNIKAQLDYLFSVQRTKQLKTIHIEQGKARDYEMMPKFAVEFITLEDTGEMGGFKYIGEVKDENTKVEEAIIFVQEFLTGSIQRSKREITEAGENKGITEPSVKRAIAILLEKKILDSIINPDDRRKVLYFLSISEERGNNAE